jgi:two-component system, sensor histidine kinase and response regulator
MKKPAILCVDDDKVILFSLKQQLKRHFQTDYCIEIAESGEEALEMVEEFLEDGIELPIVISDQIMPGMKGHELLQHIHALLPKTFSILLTGQADVEAIGSAVNNAKLYRYLNKPWNSADLKLTVKAALRSYHQERQLAQFYANLEKEVAERTDELNEKNQTLIKLNQEKNEFLGIAAHDLKNPLSAIQGYAEMMKSDFDEIPKDEMIEIIDKIYTSSRHMFELVKNLLDVNAIEVGKKELSLTTIDIYPILQALIEHYQQRAKEKNIQLHCQCAEGHYYARAEKNTIHQVFDNLLSNAVKYSPPGRYISVCLAKSNEYIHCTIRDQGPGFSEEDKQKLFGQFARLSAKPTGGEHSTGLGLFIVKKLVDAMQGKVWCESQLKQGTTFIIELPVP